MGTLFHQRQRNRYEVTQYDLEQNLKHKIELSKKYGVPLADVLALYQATEMARATDVAVNDNDTKDEQLMGFGELAQEAIALGRDFLTLKIDPHAEITMPVPKFFTTADGEEIETYRINYMELNPDANPADEKTYVVRMVNGDEFKITTNDYILLDKLTDDLMVQATTEFKYTQPRGTKTSGQNESGEEL